MLDRFIAENGSWRVLETKIQDEEHLTARLRGDALAAISRLQWSLGDDWLTQALWAGNSAIWEMVTNQAEWTRRYLCEFAEAVDTVSTLSGWDKLRGRLAKRDQGEGAGFEMRLAARALQHGLDVQLEPMVRGGRSTDLAISIGGNTLYAEASQLRRMTRAEREAQRLMDQVFPTMELLAWNLDGGGCFLRAPNSAEIGDLVRRATAFWEERRRDRSPGELVIPDLIQMWGAERGNEQARSSYTSRGFPDTFSGPRIVTDPFERIFQRIGDKIQRQLPTLAAGMLVLEPPWPLLFSPPGVVCQTLGGMLRPYPQVNAVALIRRLPSADTPNHETHQLPGGHELVVCPRYLIYREEVIIVWNQARAYRQADEVVRRLFVGRPDGLLSHTRSDTSGRHPVTRPRRRVFDPIR